MTSEVPTAQTATAANSVPQRPGIRQRFAGRSMKGALRNSGATLTNKEAKMIARQSGKSVAEVMSGALDQGITLGSGLVNQFNRGKLGPNFQNAVNLLGSTFVPGASRGFGRAIQNLQPLRGVSMPAGSVYAGSTAVTEGGKTVFTPVVMPKAVLKGALSGVSGDLGYSLPANSGTAGESAMQTETTVAASGTSEKSRKFRNAKTKARKMISNRRGRAGIKKGQQ